eukprot:28092_5
MESFGRLSVEVPRLLSHPKKTITPTSRSILESRADTIKYWSLSTMVEPNLLSRCRKGFLTFVRNLHASLVGSFSYNRTPPSQEASVSKQAGADIAAIPLFMATWYPSSWDLDLEPGYTSAVAGDLDLLEGGVRRIFLKFKTCWVSTDEAFETAAFPA